MHRPYHSLRPLQQNPPAHPAYFPRPGPRLFYRLAQSEAFVVPEEMIGYRLCEISDGGHFFVHRTEGDELRQIEAKLAELKQKVWSPP